MYKEGTIIYFTPFHFKNGNSSKNKYFVVLKKTEDNLIIASLPTSKDHVPEKHMKSLGCVEDPSISFNCFLISNQEQITKCGKCFPRNTFIYGHQIDDYEIGMLSEVYAIENKDFFVFGEMRDDIFNSLLECFRTSKNVKRKYKKIL